jgi:hypothetical protein
MWKRQFNDNITVVGDEGKMTVRCELLKVELLSRLALEDVGSHTWT